MFTEEIKTKVIEMYKNGETYLTMYLETGVPGGTIASFLRRNHPDLIRKTQVAREAEVTKKSKEFAKKNNTSLTTGQFIYESSKARFENKRQSCKKNGVEFLIEFDDLSFPAHCPMLGIPLDYLTENYRDDHYPTFDRIDNDKGYVKGNVHVISWRANRLKNNGTADEHRRIADFLDSITVKHPV